MFSHPRLAARALPTLLRATAPAPLSTSLQRSIGATAVRCYASAVSTRRVGGTTGSRSVYAVRMSAPLLRRAYSSDAVPPPTKQWSFEELQKTTKDPKASIVLVDVREPGELVATGRIPGAINIPITSSPDSFFLSDEDFEDRFGFERPAHDAQLVFYCKAGVRGRAAAQMAREAGWSSVSEYPGSWLEWAAKGGAVEH